LVGDVIRVQEAEANRKGVRLTCELPTQPIQVCADPDRMIQVITNLVTNAISYTPEAGRAVVRLLAEQRDGKNQAVIQVEDTGLGIAPEHLTRIFEPFFRVEGSVNGSGLGLTITKEIVELHGGTITVESTLGAGSRFTIWLPL
jgi:signal transduction histidine kinase